MKLDTAVQHYSCWSFVFRLPCSVSPTCRHVEASSSASLDAGRHVEEASSFVCVGHSAVVSSIRNCIEARASFVARFAASLMLKHLSSNFIMPHDANQNHVSFRNTFVFRLTSYILTALMVLKLIPIYREKVASLSSCRPSP